MSPKPLRKYPGIWAALLTVLLMVAWLVFAPRMLGGQANYVIVNGDSMEPFYHRGDLVVLFQADHAEVGDIFAYRYPELGSVIHRVVAREGERFVMKGDHNSWTDGYHPAFDDMIGKAVIKLPGVGNTVRWLRQPVRFAGVVALLAGVLVFGMVYDSSQKKNLKMRIPRFRFSMPKLPGFIAKEREGILFALSVFMFASIALGVYAFTKPLTRQEDDSVNYVNKVDYTYLAASNPEVYTNGVILSGDPVFTELNCRLRIVMDYAIHSEEGADVSGTYSARVVISEPTGWKKTIFLLPETAFKDNSFRKSTHLDVCDLQKTIDTTNELTGLNRPFYSVSVITDIQAKGTIGDRPYLEELSPTLNFSLDSAELFIVPGDDTRPDPLQWNQTGLIPGETRVANDLSIFGLEIPVFTARVIALFCFAISMAGILVLTLPVYLETRRDELTAIHMKYAPLLLKIDPAQAKRRAASAKLVELASMADLARLAQNTGQMIFEQTIGDEFHFLVYSEPYIYRYVLRVSPKEASVSELDGKTVNIPSDSTDVVIDIDKGE
jgi:signal peptidase I